MGRGGPRGDEWPVLYCPSALAFLLERYRYEQLVCTTRKTPSIKISHNIPRLLQGGTVSALRASVGQQWQEMYK